METLVIQTGVRHGRFAELMRSSEASFTIGRGYGNDLVLTDHHVDPQQLRFTRDGNRWLLCLLDDTNPVMLNGEVIDSEPIEISSGDRLNLGRTKLLLFSTNHPVEKTRKQILSNWLSAKPGNTLATITIFAVAVLLNFCIVYFETSTTLKWKEPAVNSLGLAIFIVVWAGIWAIAGRIVRHQHQFSLQILVTVVVGVVSSILVFAADYIAFPFHSVGVQESIAWVVSFILLSLLLCLNLMVATNIQRPIVTSSMVSGLVLLVIYSLVYLGKEDDVNFKPRFSNSLKPPIFKVSEGKTVQDYFNEVSVSVDELEEQRSAE